MILMAYLLGSMIGTALGFCLGNIYQINKQLEIISKREV